MAASSLIRWGGPAAVLGGVVFLLANILPVTNGMHEALWGAGFALVLVGITGVYLHLRRSGRIGLSGTLGFYMYVIAFVVPTILSLGGLLNLCYGERGGQIPAAECRSSRRFWARHCSAWLS